MSTSKLWSSTQASRFLLCKRAWAFEYVEGVKRPPSKSTELGSAVHERLELYLGVRRQVTVLLEIDEQVEAVARAMARCLPTGRVLSVEQERRRGRWRGFIDLEYEHAPGVVGVSDHKTRKSLKKYVPTEEQLSLDLQATVYVYLVAGDRGLTPEAVVPLWWTFGQTEGAARAKAVRSALQVAEAERRMALLARAVVAPGDALRAARAPANTIEPNPAACNRYGGCPYRERCALTAEQRLLGMIQEQQENDMNRTLWQDLEAQLGGQAGGPYTGVNRPAGDYTAQGQGQPQAPSQPSASYSAPPQGQGQPSYSAPAQGQGQPQAPSQPSASYSAPPQGQGQPQAPSQPSASYSAQPPPQSQAPSPLSSANTGRGFILLVGCTAQGARSLAPLLREANARASAAAGVPDYRAVEYGRGPGLFLAQLRPLLDEHLGEGVVVEADPRSPEVQIALVELEARASLTVRGG